MRLTGGWRGRTIDHRAIPFPAQSIRGDHPAVLGSITNGNFLNFRMGRPGDVIATDPFVNDGVIVPTYVIIHHRRVLIDINGSLWRQGIGPDAPVGKVAGLDKRVMTGP